MSKTLHFKNQWLFYISFLWLSCLCMPLKAQTSPESNLRIRGKVESQADNQPVIAAVVRVKSSTFRAKSDKQGTFLLNARQPLPAPVLIFEAEGFYTVEGTLSQNFSTQKDITELNIGVIPMEKDTRQPYSSLTKWLFAGARRVYRNVFKN
jgi:hypothetical protein